MVSNPRLSLFHKREIKKKGEKGRERERTLYRTCTKERMRGTKNRLRAKQYSFQVFFFFFSFFLREKCLKEKSL